MKWALVIDGRTGRLAGLLTLVALVCLSCLAPFIEVDNRIEAWVDASSEVRGGYQAFRETFGSDEFLLVAYGERCFFTPEMLDVQLDTLDALRKVGSVRQVLGIPTLYRDLFGEEDGEALREELNSSDFYQRLIFSEDGKTAGLLIEVVPENKPGGRRAAVEEIRKALLPLHAAGFDVHMAGPPMLNAALDMLSAQEAKRTFPVALVATTGLLLILLRSVRSTLVAIMNATLATGATLGLMVLTGIPLNMVTSVLPALLWVLALSGSVHLLHQFRRAEGGDARKVARVAVGRSARPCTIASLTTAAGFLSLCTAGMAPVRELGVFMAVGMVLSLAGTLLGAPRLAIWLGVVRDGAPKQAADLSSGPDVLFGLVRRHSRLIVLLGLALGIGAAALLPGLQAASDPLAFFTRDADIVREYEAVSLLLTGYYTLEVVVDTRDAWWREREASQLQRVAAELARVEGVARVISPVQLLMKLNQWQEGFSEAAYALPEKDLQREELLRQSDAFTRELLRRQVAESERQVRLSLLINVMDSRQFLRIVDESKRIVGALPGDMRAEVTGIVLQLVEAQLALVRAQVVSFFTAFCIIFLCIAGGFRSWRYALLAALPNVLPILIVLGLMNLVGLVLNPATVMVASVALGIAVDDTLYLLAAFSAARGGGQELSKAVSAALGQSASPMVMTTLTVVIGFLALLRSEFLPIAWFGGLSALAMLAALAADLLLTPALLLLFMKGDLNERIAA